jgi:DNA gyrase/topoisomerase IV subunit B
MKELIEGTHLYYILPTWLKGNKKGTLGMMYNVIKPRRMGVVPLFNVIKVLEMNAEQLWETTMDLITERCISNY